MFILISILSLSLYLLSFLYAAPRNAPGANAVRAGDVAFSHFVFRFDFKDWKVCRMILFYFIFFGAHRGLGNKGR